MSFEVVDLAPRIGAEIRTDVSTLVDGSRANEIRHLLEDRGVFVFPEIDICDDLPESEKEVIDGLKAVHLFEVSQRYWNPEPSWAELRSWLTHPPHTHRVVWKHRSGRKSLVLGCTASHVEGLGRNTGTMHRALPYAMDSDRMMHRTKLHGEESLA
jgi:alpha-ketoglutarate-dependent taurine dioxygenase